MKRSALRFVQTATAALLALAVLTATPGVATAGGTSTSRYRNTSADVSWLQVDPVDANGIVGWHQGSLYVYRVGDGQRGNVWLWIEDAYCPEGVTPYFGHGSFDGAVIEHGETPEDGCEHGFRYGDGSGLRFTIDKKLTAARVKGNVTIYGGHGGTAVGSPAIDITWTKNGRVNKSTYSYEYRSPYGIEKYQERSWIRPATVGGFVGGMGFDPARSGGNMVRSVSSSTSVWY